MNISIIDWDFVEDMGRCFEAGIKGGRTANDWKDFQWGFELEGAYEDKLNRHFRKALDYSDPRERVKHLAAVACNANILAYHIKKGIKDNG